MRRTAIILILAGAAIGMIALLVLALGREPPQPIALLRVVDAAGKPISGAVITPDGLRAKKDGSHYGWSNSETSQAATDAEGYARVRYPFYVQERLETSEISFAVEHPEFCPDRPFSVVDPTPPGNAQFKEKAKHWWTRIVSGQLIARPAPVVLQRGAIVEVSSDSLITNVQPQLAPSVGPRARFWNRTSDGTSVSRRVMAGTNWIRIIGFPDGARVHFSDPIMFVAAAGQTNRFRPALKAGLRLAGRLDDSVPRPVTNGRVLTRISTPAIGSGNLNWSAWQTIGPDGTFAFEALPPGDVELIVLCDGYVSKNNPQNISAGSRRTPQVFSLIDADKEVSVLMEPTATCEIVVADDKGQPVENATISFWPNVLWGGRGSTIFATYLMNSEDFFRSDSPPDWDKARKADARLFTAATDKHGLAIVTNLPAYNKQQAFSVEHAQFEMPIDRTGTGNGDRSGRIHTGTGETNRVAIQLQPKGTEFIEHGR